MINLPLFVIIYIAFNQSAAISAVTPGKNAGNIYNNDYYSFLLNNAGSGIFYPLKL